MSVTVLSQSSKPNYLSQRPTRCRLMAMANNPVQIEVFGVEGITSSFVANRYQPALLKIQVEKRKWYRPSYFETIHEAWLSFKDDWDIPPKDKGEGELQLSSPILADVPPLLETAVRVRFLLVIKGRVAEVETVMVGSQCPYESRPSSRITYRVKQCLKDPDTTAKDVPSSPQFAVEYSKGEECPQKRMKRALTSSDAFVRLVLSTRPRS